MRAKIVSHEIATEQELDELDRTLRAHLDDPDTLMIPNLYFLVWGRKFKTHLSERTVVPPAVMSQLPGETRPDSRGRLSPACAAPA